MRLILDTICNYPPKEVLDPPFGKSNPNFEFVILWMQNNNEICSWSDLLEVVNRSTLSIYMTRLKNEEYIKKSGFNQYQITSKGRQRYYELSQVKKKGRKLSFPPKLISGRRNYNHTILWMAYNNKYLKWSDFAEEDSPVRINQSSLSKNLSELLEKGLVKKENKEYRITQAGKSAYSRMLGLYDLDRQSILEEESKRIEEITKKTISFFEKYLIDDNDIQFRFLTNVLKLDFGKIKEVLKREEDFHKILLFLSINHPNQYPEYISPEEFSKKYEIKKTTLDYYLDEIAGNQIYTVRFFKLEIPPDKFYYFQSNEKIEMMLRVITGEHISKFTYLNTLFEKTEKIVPALNMSYTVNAILEESCQNVFNIEFKDSLREFLPEYINYLAYKIEKERKLIGISDKLEGIIWQNIPDILERSISGDSQYKFMGQSEMNYYIDTAILEIIEPFLEIKSDSLKKKTLNSLAKKDYSNLLEILEPAIKSDKNDLNLIIMKAIVLCYLNRSEESKEFLKSEIDLSSIKEEDQIFTAYSIILALSYMTIGDFESAAKFVEDTLEIYPNHPISHAIKGLVLGYNLVYRFDPDEADNENGIIDIERAIDLDSFESNKARYYQLKSQILLELSNFEDAVESIDNAIALNPGKMDLYNSKNRILIYFGEYEEVMALLDKMLVDFPEDEKNIKIKKAYILKERKNVEDGLEIINNLIEKYPEDNNLLLNKAYWLQNLNRKEAALKIIQDLIEREPENGIYHDTRGEILMNYEEYDKAINEFLKAIETSSNSFYIYQTYIKLGICYKELEDFNLAIENFIKGKELTNKYLLDIDTKRKWLTIAELYLAQIAEMESDF